MNVRSIIGVISVGLIGIALMVVSLVAYLDGQSFEVVGISESSYTFYNETYDGETYIYVFEQEKPLLIPSYVSINKTKLSAIERNAVLVIGYIEDENGLHDKEIVYLYHNDDVILSLEDYVAGNQKKFYTGAVITLIIGVVFTGLSMIFWIIEPKSLFHRRLKQYEVDPTLEQNYIPPVPGINRMDINLMNNRKQYKEIIKTIPEYTIQFNYLDEDLSNETAILFYRIGKQLVVEYVYYDEAHYILELLEETIEFAFPFHTPLEPYEFENFKNALEVFSIETGIPIVIEHIE